MIAGTAPLVPSVASLPAMTSSVPSIVPSALASTHAVWTMSEPCMPSSSTCTALSAPIDSALRIASVARAGPAVNSVTVLSIRAFLLDQQGLFDRALVDLVEHGVGGLPVERVVTLGEFAL